MESMPQEHSVREGTSRGAAPPDYAAGPPEFRPEEAANDKRMSQLARTIELEIIPRLMLAHRGLPESVLGAALAPRTISEDDVKQFAQVALSHEEDATLAAVQAYRARGVSIERIFIDLLAPTARYLGHLWDEDLSSFTDVTVGLGRLQRVLREMSPAAGRGAAHSSPGRRVLLLPSPGEQHTFGLVMVGEFFTRAGWDVTRGAWAAGVDAAALVRADWFDVIGFSLGAESRVSALCGAISAVREATCNRDLAIMVGGPLFISHPEYVERVGADAMTTVGQEAPAVAERLVGKVSRRQALPG